MAGRRGVCRPGDSIGLNVTSVRTTTRALQALLNSVFGGALLGVVSTGRYTSYVKPGFGWLLTVAAILLIIVSTIAFGNLINDGRRNTENGETRFSPGSSEPSKLRTGDEGSADHHHGRAWWLLLLPVVVMLFIEPPALGAAAAQERSNCVPPPSAAASEAGQRRVASEPLDGSAPIQMTMQEFVVRSLHDAAYSTVNNDIQLIAFIAEPPCGSTGYDLVRWRITCCAADAFALRIHVNTAAPLPVDTWVQATVRAVQDTGDADGSAEVEALVRNLAVIAQPDNPYEG